MASDAELMELARAIADGDTVMVSRRLEAAPALARAAFREGMTRQAVYAGFEAFGRQIYAGHTALHVAAGFHRPEIARALIGLGSDVGARNRRGATPLHAAAAGNPAAPGWDAAAQAATIGVLLEAGADPEAADKSGVTPLHRAVRTRCAAAVGALLDGGADPMRRNGSGSTPMKLAVLTTGRGGSGSPEARAGQAEIVRLLEMRGAVR